VLAISPQRDGREAAVGEASFGFSSGIFGFHRRPRQCRRPATLPSTEASDTDVLIPKAGILVDELLHQPDAFLILEHFD
jgi:hypothetical protein